MSNITDLSMITDSCLSFFNHPIGKNSFYVAVHAHKNYNDGRLKIDGPNFMKAEYDRGDSVDQGDGDV